MKSSAEIVHRDTKRQCFCCAGDLLTLTIILCLAYSHLANHNYSLFICFFGWHFIFDSPCFRIPISFLYLEHLSNSHTHTSLPYFDRIVYSQYTAVHLCILDPSILVFLCILEHMTI